MKILHVCNAFYPCVGGDVSYVLTNCLEQKKLGHDVSVLCLDTCHKGKTQLELTDEYKGIGITRVIYHNLRFYFPSPEIFSIIDRVTKADVIHIYNVGWFCDFLVLTKFIHRKPIVLSTMGGIFHTKKLKWIKNLYFYVWCRFLLMFVNRVVAISKKDSELFSKITSNIEVVEPGIDYNKFSRIERKPKKNTLLYVGRVAKNKRLDRLIRVVNDIKCRIPDIKLNIVGADWEGIQGGLEILVNTVNLDENVEFCGGVPDEELFEYLAECSFFVSASEYEGFGISAIEAMATGCPVILNRGSFESEWNIVAHLVDFSNSRLAGNEIAVLLEVANSTGEMALLKEFAKKYDKKFMIEKLENVYMEVCE